MFVTSNVRRWAAPIAVLLVLTACSGDDGAAEEVAEPTETAPAVAEEPTAMATTEPAATSPATEEMDGATDDAMSTDMPDAAEAVVDVASTDLGDVLVDADGLTLYLFTPDDGGESTCYDNCAQNWPPLIVEGDVSVGEELDESLFATVARDDGAEQVTVDGWPLYLFAGDSAPGDVNGQGVNDVWFAVTPTGEPVES